MNVKNLSVFWLAYEAPRTTTIGPQFSGDLFLVVTHLLPKQPSYICMGPLRNPFYSLILSLRQPIRPLSLPIRPFQGPLYTAIGPFFPVPPGQRVRGSGVVCTGSGPLDSFMAPEML